MKSIKKKNNSKPIPITISYLQFVPHFVIPTKDLESKMIRKDISLKIQGDAFEVTENYPTPILMILLDVARTISPEMILDVQNQRISVFNHWDIPIIKDNTIQKINLSDSEKLGSFVPELVIDLESIWEKYKSMDYIKAIESSLDDVIELFRPSIITTLIGDAPVLLFLLTQYLLYGKTSEIWYQEKIKSIPIKITKYE